MLANRRAARMEEISEHGRPVSMRSALHKSKKVYDRKRLKRAGIINISVYSSSTSIGCHSLQCRVSGIDTSKSKEKEPNRFYKHVTDVI